MNITKQAATNDIKNASDSKAMCLKVLKDATATDRGKAIKDAIRVLESHQYKKTALTIVVAETN